MSTSIMQLKGKEFLHDENILISNYNPFDTSNASGIDGLYTDHVLYGTLYLYDKANFREPIQEEFRTIKTKAEFETTFKLDNILNILPKSINVSITNKYTISDGKTFTLVTPNLEVVLTAEELLNYTEGNFYGLLSITHSTTNPNKKVYTDLATVDQYLLYIIPSSEFSNTDTTKLCEITIDASLIFNNFNNVKLLLNKNILPNKFCNRLREELLTGLFIKEPENLRAYHEDIKFVNNLSDTVGINLDEMIYPLLLPEEGKIFMEWLTQLAEETNFDNYNNYLYWTLTSYPGHPIYGKKPAGRNSHREYDLIIPEIIFNILYTKDLKTLNYKILTNYLISNPPTLEIDPEGKLNNNLINIILDWFVYFRLIGSGSETLKTAITYTSTGMNLPMFKQTNFYKEPTTFKYIFVPQRHKHNKQTKSILGTFTKIPAENTELNKFKLGFSSTELAYKVPTNAINKFLIEDYLAQFDYFMSPSGLDANGGTTIYTPKSSTFTIPAGKKVLMLPGTYNGSMSAVSDYAPINYHGYGHNYSVRFLSIFRKYNNHKIYGFGNLTIINYNNQDLTYSKSGNFTTWSTSQLYGYPDEANWGSVTPGYFCNLKINWSTNNAVLNGNEWYICRIGDTGSVFKNVNFSISGKYSINQQTLSNCIRTGGTLVGTSGTISSITHATNSLEDIVVNKLDELFPTNKDKITNIKNSYVFKPMYTLLPLYDNLPAEESDGKINLNTLSSIMYIGNLKFQI